MKEILTDNAKFQGIRAGNVICHKCDRIICRVGKNVKSFKLVFVCRCGSMGKTEYHSPKKKFDMGSTAIMKENRLICPVCEEELGVFMEDSYVSMGFRIRCHCGAIYDKYKDYSKINMRLKEYR